MFNNENNVSFWYFSNIMLLKQSKHSLPQKNLLIKLVKKSNFRLYLQKLTSFKAIESIVLSNQSVLKMQRREKAEQLSRSIQQQLTKAKHICEVMRSRKGTAKLQEKTIKRLLSLPTFGKKEKPSKIINFFAAKDFMISCLHKNPNDRATIQQLLDHEFLARMEKYRWTII